MFLLYFLPLEKSISNPDTNNKVYKISSIYTKGTVL